MALIQCPECGKEISEKATSCPNCGYAFENMKFCKHCGAKIFEDSVICTNCGRQVEELESNNDLSGGIHINNVSNSNSSSSASASAAAVAQQNGMGMTRPPKEINKITALILCVLFGWVGAHKFYEGRVGLGILYIFTMGLFGIGWIVDFIIILTKPNPYYVYYH